MRAFELLQQIAPILEHQVLPNLPKTGQARHEVERWLANWNDLTHAKETAEPLLLSIVRRDSISLFHSDEFKKGFNGPRAALPLAREAMQALAREDAALRLLVILSGKLDAKEGPLALQLAKSSAELKACRKENNALKSQIEDLEASNRTD